jgi:hypothetical protein
MAIEDQLRLAVSNLDVVGALSSAAITEADLHAGRYDDAAVTIWLVNWADVSERVILRSGFLGHWLPRMFFRPAFPGQGRRRGPIQPAGRPIPLGGHRQPR